MKNPALISKIKSLEALTAEEKAELIALLNNTKKYGLVWEDKPEEVEELLRTQLPVLQEVPERCILAKDLPATGNSTAAKTNPRQSGLFDEQPTAASTGSAAGNTGNDTGTMDAAAGTTGAAAGTMDAAAGNTGAAAETTGAEPVEAPNHILIEGDNLHALTALSFTHEGKIDVIYIDPPYNTGNKDFKYNDSFVDREDSYRHSKWLSFMHKRLQIAKRLLSEKGVIFISIDDNEQAQLKLLCDEVFNEDCFIANVVWQKRTSPDSRRILGPAHDNVYVYGKTILGYENLNYLALTEEQERVFKNPDNDPRGPWVSSDFTAQGFRPNQMYEIITPAGVKYFPPEGRCWKNIESVFKKQVKEGKIWFGFEGKNMPRRKTYLLERKGSVPWTWWDHKNFGNNQDAKKEIIDCLGKSTAFDTPKPLKLLQNILTISTNNDSTILDFFAGSGTTLHATMQLNAEDGGSRQCILVTNNENNIAEEVCYERNRRVIQGYANSKGQWVEGLPGNNLRYYRTEFVGSAKTTKNKKQLTRLATELLCIKEDIYSETGQIAGFVFNTKTARCFCDSDKYMLVIYDEELIEELIPVITAIQSRHKIKIYVFAPGQYPFTEEFEEVLDKIELCALPDAIYKAYTGILPKKTVSRLSAEGNQPAENQASTEVDLFTANTPEA